MAQGAGVGGCEGRRGTDTAGHDEFGTMESPTGAREGQGLSPPVVRVLDAFLHAAQFTPEQWGLIEVELQSRLAPYNSSQRGIDNKIWNSRPAIMLWSWNSLRCMP
jgi:hypothetical protein